MTVREATGRDAPELARLITLAYRVEDFFKTGDRIDLAGVREKMREGSFLVAEDRGALAGCVFVSARSGLGYFGLLSVVPSQQRRGLGQTLVHAAEEFCRSAGCHTMEIEVVNLRPELLPFYRKRGYAEFGARPFPQTERSTRPCHFVVLRKPLGRRAHGSEASGKEP